MKILLLLLPLLPWSLLAQDEKANGKRVGILKLTDGVVLRGNPEGSQADDRIGWRVSDLVDPVLVSRSSILEMRLRGGRQPKDKGKHRAVVTLNNGDTLDGQFAGMTETHVQLETLIAGELEMPRSMISNIEFPAQGTFYSGPKSLKNWTVDGEKDSWQLHSGQLVSRKGASIAQEFDTLDRFRLSFVLGWGRSLRFRVQVLSDSGITANPDNCYELVCMRQRVFLRKRWLSAVHGGSEGLGEGVFPEFDREKLNHFDLYCDRKAGAIALYVNGVLVGDWKDPKPAVGSFGKWVSFVSEPVHPLVVSRIRLSTWKGELP